MATGLQGVRDLTAQLTNLGAAVASRELRGVAKEALEPALHRARASIPVGIEPHKTYRGRLVSPGFAQASLHIETALDKRTGSAMAILGVSREAFYAVNFVEIGTAHNAPQPWLRPAFAASEEEMIRTLADRLRERVEKAVRRRARAATRNFKNSFFPGGA